ncbi:MAG: hypothetical protein OEW72_09085 [Gammaproteobacteria bacterium]|nr:hypothetical protein [Gammaproteobacteria bacterium]
MGSDSPTTLRDYADRFRLHVHCPACNHQSPLNLMKWAQLAGWNTPLETLRHALRCGECGNNVGIELPMSARQDLVAPGSTAESS